MGTSPILWGDVVVAECTVPVASLGYARIEDVPLFHVAPGGSALRVVLPAACDPPVRKCPELCGDLGELVAAAGSESPIRVKCEQLSYVAARWKVDAAILEGVCVASRAYEELLEHLRSTGLEVGVRVLGADGRDPIGPLRGVDFVLVDCLCPLVDDVEYRVATLKAIERLSGTDVGLEVVVYMEEPRVEQLTPVLHRIPGNSALHIVVGNPMGGGPARLVYEEARRRHPYTYLHAPPYDRLDTHCPRCGSLVAVREDSRLVSLKAPGGRCWKCGFKLPFSRVVYERTPASILRRSGAGTVWHDPRLLAGSFIQGHT